MIYETVSHFVLRQRVVDDKPIIVQQLYNSSTHRPVFCCIMVFHPGSLTSLCNLIHFNTRVNKRDWKIRWTERMVGNRWREEREWGRGWMSGEAKKQEIKTVKRRKVYSEKSEKERKYSRMTWEDQWDVTALCCYSCSSAHHKQRMHGCWWHWLPMVTWEMLPCWRSDKIRKDV